MPYNREVIGSPSLSRSLLALALSACTSQCPQGPTTTCWCPGEVVGESACGDDGLYGPCVCPGSVGLAPVPVVPTPPVLPPAPMPIPGPMIPSMIPLGIDPPPATRARDETIAGWIAGPLRGHDNRSAAIRSVEITSAAGAYRIYVQNQFGFRCDLDFDADGNPSAMRDCRSREPEWSAQPLTGTPPEQGITVTCEDRGPEMHCEAPYQLRTRDGYHTRESFVFSRPLLRTTIVGAPRHPPLPRRPPRGEVLDPWESAH